MCVQSKLCTIPVTVKCFPRLFYAPHAHYTYDNETMVSNINFDVRNVICSAAVGITIENKIATSMYVQNFSK